MGWRSASKKSVPHKHCLWRQPILSRKPTFPSEWKSLSSPCKELLKKRVFFPYKGVVLTMKNRIAVGVFAVAVLMVAIGTAGESLKSGPAVGEAIYSRELGRGPFHPLNCTGASAGQKNCLV